MRDLLRFRTPNRNPIHISRFTFHESFCVVALCLLISGCTMSKHEKRARAETSHSLILFVATNGNDAWSGKLPSPNGPRTDGPFATIQHALRASRELRQQPSGQLAQSATITVRGGIYF